MEKVLEQTLSRLTSIDENLGLLKNDVATLKSDVATLKGDVATLKSDVATLKGDVATLKSDVATLKSDVAIIKTDLHRLEGRMDAVYEQTAELLEFKTEITEKVDIIINDNKSLQEIIGEHEIAIRSLRRKPGVGG